MEKGSITCVMCTPHGLQPLPLHHPKVQQVINSLSSDILAKL